MPRKVLIQQLDGDVGISLLGFLLTQVERLVDITHTTTADLFFQHKAVFQEPAGFRIAAGTLLFTDRGDVGCIPTITTRSDDSRVVPMILVNDGAIVVIKTITTDNRGVIIDAITTPQDSGTVLAWLSKDSGTVGARCTQDRRFFSGFVRHRFTQNGGIVLFALPRPGSTAYYRFGIAGTVKAGGTGPEQCR